MTLLINSLTVDTFFKLYYQLISRRMFIKDFLKKSDIEEVLHKANELLGSNERYKLVLDRIKKEMNLPAKSLLVHYFYNAFTVNITAESGWSHIEHYALSHLPDDNGFELSLDINKSMPAIINFDNKIHGGNHRQEAPALMIRINAYSNIFPYSYLQLFNLSRLKLKVEVKGFKDLVVQNDHGLVDRSKPFLPFGPIPVQGSCCYIGGYEYATKNVSRLSVNINWKNLPGNYAGFAGYYEGYDKTVTNADFKVLLSTSSAGGWLPENESQKQLTTLFDAHKDSGILVNSKQIDVKLRGQFTSLSSASDENQFIDMNQLKNGYLKLKLATSELVFGHKNYPAVMAKVLTHNTRNKRQLSLPEAPYTPEITSISVDYCAEEQINLTPQTLQQSHNAPKSGEHKADYSPEDFVPALYYMTTMGVEHIHAKAASCGVSFFPEWPGDGNLYIGFLKSDKVKSFNLYFNLKNDATQPTTEVNNVVDWSYYSESGWKKLKLDMILADSTNYLMRSGIITIRLPARYL